MKELEFDEFGVEEKGERVVIDGKGEDIYGAYKVMGSANKETGEAKFTKSYPNETHGKTEFIG